MYQLNLLTLSFLEVLIPHCGSLFCFFFFRFFKREELGLRWIYVIHFFSFVASSMMAIVTHENEHWTRLSREVFDAPTLSVSEAFGWCPSQWAVAFAQPYSGQTVGWDDNCRSLSTGHVVLILLKENYFFLMGKYVLHL